MKQKEIFSPFFYIHTKHYHSVEISFKTATRNGQPVIVCSLPPNNNLYNKANAFINEFSEKTDTPLSKKHQTTFEELKEEFDEIRTEVIHFITTHMNIPKTSVFIENTFEEIYHSLVEVLI